MVVRHTLAWRCPSALAAGRRRGLLLVQALAGDWGYRRGQRGTTVWFQVAGSEPPWLG